MVPNSEETPTPAIDNLVLETWIRKAKRRTRIRRLALACIPAVVSGIMTVVGIKMIGRSIELVFTSQGAFTNWHVPQLEYGIFTTLVGTIALVFTLNFLIEKWKMKEV